MHTPGPWRVDGGNICLHVTSADGGFSTGCISWDGNGAANAALIAAAPDLLSVLRAAAERYHVAGAHERGSSHDPHNGEWNYCNSLPCRHAQFAIAKAEGR
jgi:hypothetical protein